MRDEIEEYARQYNVQAARELIEAIGVQLDDGRVIPAFVRVDGYRLNPEMPQGPRKFVALPVEKS